MERIFQKTAYLVIVLAFLFVGGSSTAHAQVIDVDFEQTPLFNQANFLPGEAVSRTITVSNLTDTPQEARLRTYNETEKGSLAEVLYVSIVRNSIRTEYYSDTLGDLFDRPHVSLGTVLPQSTATYRMTVTFHPDAGNEYQSDSAEFSLCVGFAGPIENCVTDGNSGNPTGGGSGDDDDDNETGGDDSGDGSSNSSQRSGGGGSLLDGVDDTDEDSGEEGSVDFGKMLSLLLSFLTNNTNAEENGSESTSNEVQTTPQSNTIISNDGIPSEFSTTSTSTIEIPVVELTGSQEPRIEENSDLAAAAFLSSITLTEWLLIAIAILLLIILWRLLSRRTHDGE